MDMIEAIAQAIEYCDHGLGDSMYMDIAQAVAEAVEPFIQARIDEAVKAEREACAGVADQEALACDEGDEDAYWIAAASIARAIRARGEV